MVPTAPLPVSELIRELRNKAAEPHARAAALRTSTSAPPVLAHGDNARLLFDTDGTLTGV